MTRLVSLLLTLCLVVGLGPAFGQKKSGGISDDAIYDQVRLKLTSNADVNGGGIEVIVKDGEVTLKGKVRTDKIKHKAESLAGKVKGVKHVVNELTVNPI